ncbi:DUF4267 domain-containing protein [Pedobacter mendelii]|uniref:DUF4267 domain-containing protein n=1 Tax=Pedobacter jejuensis TaxID=1268550 RepID=A0A3N0BQT7_9SPHI|nr:DUF4267 domain-containing protein [Pedobacter jejuensis]
MLKIVLNLFSHLQKPIFNVRFTIILFHGRDIFSGLIICGFMLLNERRALGITLLFGTMIPLNDMVTVLSKNYNGVLQALPHVIAIIVCFVFGIVLLITKPKLKAS